MTREQARGARALVVLAIVAAAMFGGWAMVTP